MPSSQRGSNAILSSSVLIIAPTCSLVPPLCSPLSRFLPFLCSALKNPPCGGPQQCNSPQ